MAKKIRIAWGIDPYSTLENVDDNILIFLKKLQKHADLEIYPVHVTSATLSIYSRYSESTTPVNFKPQIKEDVDKYLQKFSEIELREAIVLENFTSFRRSELNVFCDYIEELNCDFTLLASQGRSGFKRLMLGSFAENYIFRAKKPTFIINPEMKKDFDLTSAIVPVEMEEDSKEFSTEAINEESLGFIKKMHFYHHINSQDFEDQDWAPSLYTPAGHDYSYYINKAKEKAEVFLKTLIDQPDKGKELSSSVTKEHTGLEEIVRYQSMQLDVGLLLLKSHSGFVESLFTSSLSKELIRKINIPVLIYPRKHQFE